MIAREAVPVQYKDKDLVQDKENLYVYRTKKVCVHLIDDMLTDYI